MEELIGYISGASELTGDITDNEYSLTGGLSNDYPVYTGLYVITPNSNTQLLNTAGTLVTDNIRVEPIPSNYGLITWNGSVLTVS